MITVMMMIVSVCPHCKGERERERERETERESESHEQMWGIVMMDANRCDDGDCGEEEDWG